jgi:putative FmdB family regulatory protein
MPRYKYQCSECAHVVLVFHGIDDVFTDHTCIICESQDTLKKILTRPTIVQNTTTTTEQEVGEITKEHIEANREILEQQKKEAKEETYEPS